MDGAHVYDFAGSSSLHEVLHERLLDKKHTFQIDCEDAVVIAFRDFPENRVYLQAGVVDIRDIAAVAVQVLSGSGHEGQAYVLTGPEALTNSQIAEKLSRALGRTIRYVDVPPADFKRSLVAAGLPEWSADALIDLQRLYREGGASLVDPTVERVLGRKATLFDEFVRDYRSAFQQDARAAS